MTAIPLTHLFGIGSKLAASACCGWMSQQISSPAVGILLGAAILIPLASSLEDIFQLPELSRGTADKRRTTPQPPALSYPETRGLAHSGMR